MVHGQDADMHSQQRRPGQLPMHGEKLVTLNLPFMTVFWPTAVNGLAGDTNENVPATTSLVNDVTVKVADPPGRSVP